MEVKKEDMDVFYQESVEIKQEPVFTDSCDGVKVAFSDGKFENNFSLPVDTCRTIKTEADSDSTAIVFDEIGEVKASDFFVDTSELINIKKEVDNKEQILKELLNEECDLKCDVKDVYLDQPCSSKQSQLLEQSKQSSVNKFKKYPCPVCNKNFGNAVEKKNHLGKHRNKIVICSHCGKFIIQRQEYLKHVFTHFIKKNIKRKEIISKLVKKSNLSLDKTKKLKVGSKIQLVNNNKNKPKNVDECDSKYKELLHCEECFKCFLTHSALKEHMMFAHHKIKSEYSSSLHDLARRIKYECEECSKEFSNKIKFKKHMAIHTAKNPFKCKFCPKMLTRATSKEHMLIHKSKGFECHICNKSFTTPGNLGIHSVVHDSHKAYKCEICSKSFSRNGNLKTHMRIHTAEKPFKCEMCPKSYAQKKNLTEHYRHHTGEKPFVCDLCHKSFTLERTLKRHMVIHNGEKAFKCDICSRSFNQKSSLAKHIEVTHSGPEIDMIYQVLAVELDEGSAK